MSEVSAEGPQTQQPWEREKLENPVINERNKARDRASDFQRKGAEIQAARYESTLYRLMERSGNDRDLINALNQFTRVFDSCSHFGEGDQPMPPTEVKRLTQFFEDFTNLLPDAKRPRLQNP
jgi:hypothetical protein